MAARSTTPGTPVKSCISTRSGVRAISAASVAADAVALGVDAPAGHRLDVGAVDGQAVLVAEQVLQHDLDRVGQAGHVEPVGQGVDPEDLVAWRRRRRGRPRAPKESGAAEGGLCHAPILPRSGRGEPGGSGPLRCGCGTAGWPAGSAR